MKRRLFLTAVSFLTLVLGRPQTASAQGDPSLRNEVQAAINRGLKYLGTQQDTATGSVGNTDYPGITALYAMAVMGNPEAGKSSVPETAQNAYDFLLTCQKEDGSIFATSLPNYNTSLSLTALTMISGEKYREAALKARRAVIGGQYDHDKNGKMDTQYDGGIGYGSSPPADMSNTHFALEALYHAKKLFADDPDRQKQEPELNYAAAIQFVSRCQNLTATNDQSWASDDPKNKGGFVYRPDDSKAGKDELPDGKTANRSYASMGYAGLLAFLYADVGPEDQRIKAVKEWLAKNYSVKENPGLGEEGLYYYYHTMAKALNLASMDYLTLPDGTRANWRLDLSRQLFNLQHEDGSWSNANGRWMEKDPVIATAYSVLALEHIIRGL